jgi:hypothetical protein
MKNLSQVWWCTSLIPALEARGSFFQASQTYIDSVSKRKKKKKIQMKGKQNEAKDKVGK